MGAALERSAFSVDVVHKGIEALKVLHRSCPYDLVITELLLDEISGFALVIAAKKYPDVATIGINNGGASLKLVADEFGIDAVLGSPPDLKEGIGRLDLKLEWLSRENISGLRSKTMQLPSSDLVRSS
jgi:DNA-binding response OmpR family regulator